MRTDAEWEVDVLRLKSRDLLRKQRDRRRIAWTHAAKELLVTFVSAEDGIWEIKEDNRRFAKERVVLIFNLPLRHRFTSSRSDCSLSWRVRSLAANGINVLCMWKSATTTNVRLAIPRCALPELFGARISLLLRCTESRRLRLPRRELTRRFTGNRNIGGNRTTIKCLRGWPDRLPAEAERLALVRGHAIQITVAREDADDDHVLAEFAKVRDQAAAGECGIIRMR